MGERVMDYHGDKIRVSQAVAEFWRNFETKNRFADATLSQKETVRRLMKYFDNSGSSKKNSTRTTSSSQGKIATGLRVHLRGKDAGLHRHNLGWKYLHDLHKKNSKGKRMWQALAAANQLDDPERDVVVKNSSGTAAPAPNPTARPVDGPRPARTSMRASGRLVPRDEQKAPGHKDNSKTLDVVDRLEDILLTLMEGCEYVTGAHLHDFLEEILHRRIPYDRVADMITFRRREDQMVSIGN
eukprot:g4439.t1